MARPILTAFLCSVFLISKVVAGQPPAQMAWPISGDDRSKLGQVFAEYGAVVAGSYHTGIDIMGGGNMVTPAAYGTIVYIQRNDTRSACTHPAPTISRSCSDHGFGNTVIIRHDQWGSPLYTQYSHLASFDLAIEKACGIAPTTYVSNCSAYVAAGAILGITGGSGYGSPTYWGAHLHFEVKTVDTVNVGNSFGYSSSYPSDQYRDPLLYLHGTQPSSNDRLAVTTDANLYRGPGGGTKTTYGIVGKAAQGQTYGAIKDASYTLNPSCSGWIQIATTNGTRFKDPMIPPGELPRVWICRDVTRPLPATISVAPATAVSFGSVATGSVATQTLTVQNTGGGTLIGSAAVASPFSIASGGSYSLSGGQSQQVQVRFSPTAAQFFSQNVTFTGAGSAARAVSGTGTTVSCGRTFCPGDIVTVYGTGGLGLSLRSCASASCTAITVMPDGTTMRVVGGPTQAGGYSWWNLSGTVRGISRSGWAAGNWLKN